MMLTQFGRRASHDFQGQTMATRVELKEGSLVWQVEQLAEQTAQPVEDVLATAVETYLDQLEREGIHAETQAFWSMQKQLASEYADQHVAIYKGKVVDHDADVVLLERRTRARFGVLPVLIAPVKPDGRHELHWRGGRMTGSLDQ